MQPAVATAHMNAEHSCPECGTRLTKDAPGGLCPRCLVRQGMEMLGAAKETGLSPGTEVIAPEAPPHPRDAGMSARRVGDYELLGVIAHGGMGVVYHARQASLNREVALKMILSGQLATPAEVQRFRTEAEAAAKLDHPNIVPIYEIGEFEGQHYFTMKLVEGGRLSDEIGGKPMPARRAAALMICVARAVHFAHQRGILHRDLKPTNILLDKQGEPQLTDFGLAKIAEHESNLTRSELVMGTANYIAPEQASGRSRQLTTAADVYGLGAILFEMLTGHPPFQGANFMETLRQVIETEPPRPTSLNPQLDRDLETICLKCLEKSPEHRYDSAEALAEDLSSWLAGETIQARPATTWERTVKWARRKPAVAALIAGLLVVAAAGLAGIIWQWGRAEDSRRFAERKAADAAQKSELALATAKTLRRHLYAADMNLAQRSLAENNFGRAVELLGKYLPGNGEDLRGFEWRYLWNLTRGHELATFPHPQFVETVVFSPDGQRLAITGHQSSEGPWQISLWDVVNRKLIGTIPGLRQPIRMRQLIFSPDGKWLAGGAVDQSVYVWATGECREVAHLTNQRFPVVFLPDGTMLTKTPQDQFAAWDMSSWAQREYKQPGVDRMGSFRAYSPDGSMMVLLGSGREIQVWKVASLSKTASFNCTIDGLETDTTSWAVSADGNYVALGFWKGDIKLLDTRAGRQLGSWKAHASAAWAVGFSPDSTRLASCGFDQAIHLWNLPGGTWAGTYRGHFSEVWTVSFAPDGKLLASGSKDGTAKLWPAFPERDSRALSEALVPMAFLANGAEILAMKPDRTLAIWDVRTRKELQTIPIINQRRTGLLPASVTHDSDYLGMELTMQVGRERPLNSFEIWSKRDPHGTKFMVSPNYGNTSTAISPDKRWLAVAAQGFVDLIDLATGKTLARLPGAMQPVSFSPDGSRLATAGEKYTVKLWDTAQCTLVTEFQAHRWVIWSLVFSPDSTLLASCSTDATVGLWNGKIGRPVAVLKGHKEGVPCVAFSPDGRTLASGSTDETVKLWSLETYQELMSIGGFGTDIGAVLFSPDGRTLAVAPLTSRGEVVPVQLWHAPSLAEIDASLKAN